MRPVTGFSRGELEQEAKPFEQGFLRIRVRLGSPEEEDIHQLKEEEEPLVKSSVAVAFHVVWLEEERTRGVINRGSCRTRRIQASKDSR